MGNRKSFLLHLDSLNILDEMTNEQAGILFKAIKSYQYNEEIELDFGMKMAFAPFKNQFIRDEEIYKKTCERNSINGLKGGRPITEKTQVVNKITKKTQVVNSEPKKPDSDSDSKNDSDNKNDKNKKSMDDRKLKFAYTLEQFKNDFPREMLNEFYRYWSEPNKSGTKFKQELERTWDLRRRLDTWAARDEQFNKYKKEDDKPPFTID